MLKEQRSAQVWIGIEDYLVPLLELKPGERAVYCHLLRHSWLEGRSAVMITAPQLARGVALRASAARQHLFRLARKGCLRFKAYGKGYLIRVLLPEEVIRELRPQNWAWIVTSISPPRKDPALRRAILRRERGRCFYCQKKLREQEVWFDHIVPLARSGGTGPENIVACCQPCNRRKGVGNAARFLRRVWREKGLGRAELRKRLAVLREILRGNTQLRRAA